jgi:hypothetical protein
MTRRWWAITHRGFLGIGAERSTAAPYQMLFPRALLPRYGVCRRWDTARRQFAYIMEGRTRKIRIALPHFERIELRSTREQTRTRSDARAITTMWYIFCKTRPETFFAHFATRSFFWNSNQRCHSTSLTWTTRDRTTHTVESRNERRDKMTRRVPATLL